MSLLFTHEKSTMQELSNMHKAAEKGNDFDSRHDFVTSPSNWTGQNEKFYVAEKWEFSDAKVWLLWRRRWEGRRRALGCWARGRYYTALSTLPTEPPHTHPPLHPDIIFPLLQIWSPTPSRPLAWLPKFKVVLLIAQPLILFHALFCVRSCVGVCARLDLEQQWHIRFLGVSSGPPDQTPSYTGKGLTRN